MGGVQPTTLLLYLLQFTNWKHAPSSVVCVSFGCILEPFFSSVHTGKYLLRFSGLFKDTTGDTGEQADEEGCALWGPRNWGNFSPESCNVTPPSGTCHQQEDIATLWAPCCGLSLGTGAQSETDPLSIFSPFPPQEHRKEVNWTIQASHQNLSFQRLVQRLLIRTTDISITHNIARKFETIRRWEVETNASFFSYVFQLS